MMNAIVALTPLLGNPPCIQFLYLIILYIILAFFSDFFYDSSLCLITQYFSFLQSLPAPVKRRLKALKRIQLESTKIEAKFYEEVHKLECKYHEMYKPLYDQRAKITKGKHFLKTL